MKIDLQRQTGLPIAYDGDALRLVLGDGLNEPSYRVRMTRDHEPVWA
jgi:hypothetical protein